jgi:hypothetical protein
MTFAACTAFAHSRTADRLPFVAGQLGTHGVSVAGLGTMVAFIPKSWAEKAARLLGACEDEAAFQAELARIRTAMDAATR